MEAGALGYVVKDAPAEQLADAVRRVTRGERVVDPALAAATLAGGPSPLTGRERDVLLAARDGATIADIARKPVHEPAPGRYASSGSFPADVEPDVAGSYQQALQQLPVEFGGV
jgi:hypothetical protein